MLSIFSAPSFFHSNPPAPPRPDLNHIFTKASTVILHVEIHHSRSELNRLSSKVFKLHLKLSSLLSFDIWSMIDCRSFNSTFNIFEATTAQQIHKYNNLLTSKCSPQLSHLLTSHKFNSLPTLDYSFPQCSHPPTLHHPTIDSSLLTASSSSDLTLVSNSNSPNLPLLHHPLNTFPNMLSSFLTNPVSFLLPSFQP
jgi:hypothetical protein